MLVLGYIWLPFVALPIFVSLESLDRRLLEAAERPRRQPAGRRFGA